MASTASVSTDCDSETSSVSVTIKQNSPEVVRFAFKEFIIDGTVQNKWKARCSTCRETITETRGTTTEFARYVQSVCTLHS